MLKEFAALAILCGLLTPSTGWARKVEAWPYDRLFQEADLVVIGTAKSVDASKDVWPEDEFSKDRFIGVETAFDVSSVLKGGASDSISVIHFNYKQDAVRYEDGPGLVSFLNKPTSSHAKRTDSEPRAKQTDRDDSDLEEQVRVLKRRVLKRRVSQPEYLLFLKKRSDGFYEAVSGQMDPAFSVRALSQPGGSR